MVRAYVDWPIDFVLATGLAVRSKSNPSEDISKLNFQPLLNRNSNGLAEEYSELEMDTTYVLELVIGTFEDGPIPNFEVPTLLFEFEEYPPIMHAQEGPGDYLYYRSLQSKTNDTGFYFIEIKINYGGIGAYVGGFDVGTALSIPYSFKTENTLKSIKILTEPDYVDVPFDVPELNATYTGRVFDGKARVRIDVTKGPKDNYIVIAYPKKMGDNDLTLEIFPLTQFDLDEKKENYIAWVTIIEGIRYAKTNRYGEATFPALSVWDISGTNATTKFYFGAGDRHEGLFLTTNLTNSSHTFVPSMNFEMIQEPSKYIAAYQTINPQPKIKVTAYSRRIFLFINMQLSELFNAHIQDTYFSEITDKYTTGSL